MSFPFRPGVLSASSLCFLLGFGGAAAAPGQGGPWSNVGPGGGWIHAVAPDPLSPGVYFAATESGGVFRSEDYGSSWTISTGSRLGSPVVRVEGDPSRAGRLYALAERALFLSEDGGGSWTATAPLPLSGGTTTELAVDTEHDVIFVGTTSGLLRSSDLGATWRRTPPGSPRSWVTSLAMHPAAPGTLYAANFTHLFRTSDGGATWTQLPPPPGGLPFRVFGHPRVATALFLTTRSGGIFRSLDSGLTWEPRDGTLEGSPRLLLVTRPDGGTLTLYAQNGQGLWRTSNGGADWTLLAQEPFVGTVARLTADPFDEGVLLAATWSGAFRSVDAGEHWSEVHPGLQAFRITGLAADRRSPTALVAGSSSGEFHRTADGGGTWSRSADPDPLTGIRLPLIADPAVPGRLFRATSEGTIVRSVDGGRSWEGRVSFPCSFTAGLGAGGGPSPVVYGSGLSLTSGCGLEVPEACFTYRSLDGGETWQCTGENAPFSAAVAVDPGDPDRVFVGSSFSRDGGASWSTGQGLEGEVHALVIDPADPDTLYAGAEGGLFASSDGGLGWRLSGGGLAPGPVTGLLFDPTEAGTLYAVAGGALHRSTDQASTWHALDPAGGSPPLSGPLVLHPSEGGFLYAGTEDRGVVRRALPSAACTEGPETLCLRGGRFQAEVSWRDFRGRVGNGRAVPLTAQTGASETGAFWFFGPDNLELVVKVLDGRDFNGHFWVFYGALSNVEYTLRVTDTATGAARTYLNPSGSFGSRGDTRAFDAGSGASRSSSATDPASLPGAATTGVEVLAVPPSQGFSPFRRPGLGAIPDAGPGGTTASGTAAAEGCSSGGRVLCLGGRFELRVRWRDFRGREGVGQAVPLTGETGYFWFFGSSNVELVVKILDGRANNQHFWLFYGALSNVEYALEVTDTATGEVRTYFNPSGTFASRGDTRAFPGSS